MKIGEPFNPRAKDLGFFPAEIVDKRRDLTDGQKLLYHRMVGWARLEDGERHNERAGEVWRSHETIADDLGKCERQIRRDLEALETAGLLDHRSRDGRKSNTYFFLFHPSFDRTSESAQTASAAKECPAVTGHPCPSKADLSGRPRPANHKASNQKTESSSSGLRTGEEQRAMTDQATTTSPAEALTADRDRWWTVGDLQQARTAIAQHRGRGAVPDEHLTGQVLATVRSMLEFRLWLGDLSCRFPGQRVRGWGFYAADARDNWPTRRAEVEALHRAAVERTAAQQRETEAEWNRIVLDTGAPQSRVDTSPSAVAETPGPQLVTAPAKLAPPCGICSGFGIVGELADAKWCSCPAGDVRRATEPDAIEKQHRTAKAPIYGGARPVDLRKVGGFQRAGDNAARLFARVGGAR